MNVHYDTTPDHFGDNGSADESQLRLALTILRKRKWLILLITLAMTSLAVIVAWSMPPIYNASATLQLEGQSNLINIDEVVASEIAADEYLQTQVELMRTPQLASKVVDKLNLMDHWELNPRVPVPQEFEPKNAVSRFTNKVLKSAKNIVGIATNLASKYIPALRESNTDSTSSTITNLEPDEIERLKVVDSLMKNTRIVAVKGTNKLFKVSYQSRDPQLAASIANAFGELYVLENTEMDISKTELATQRLSEKLDGLKLTLAQSEDSVLRFMQENGLVNVRGDVQGLNEQEIRSVTDNLIESRKELQNARGPYEQVRLASNNSLDTLAMVPAISSDPNVHLARREVQEAERVLKELGNRYLPKHPKVIDADSNLQISTSNLELQVEIVSDRILTAYQNAQNNYSALQTQLTENKNLINSMAEKKLELNKLQKQADTDRELYEIFFDRVRETNETIGLTPAIANFANVASAPLNPVKPNKMLIVFTIFLLGLVGSAIASLSLEQYIDTIQGIHDVERKLGINVLGVVPKVKSRSLWTNKDRTLVPGSISDPDGRFIESMRTLRTSLKLADLSKSSMAVLVTSSIPEEGKSTVASNLALSMAKTDSTLFIEADMRRPGFSNSMKMNHPGLSDLLSDNEYQPSHCIQRALIGNVDVISAGNISEESPELLAGERFDTLLSIFKKHYKWIIIDSAPVQAVSDALLIGQATDAAIFVVQSDSTISTIASRAVKRLQQYKINILGAVITQVDLDHVHSYGGEHYYQGYFDKYGYANSGGPQSLDSSRMT